MIVVGKVVLNIKLFLSSCLESFSHSVSRCKADAESCANSRISKGCGLKKMRNVIVKLRVGRITKKMPTMETTFRACAICRSDLVNVTIQLSCFVPRGVAIATIVK